MTERKENTLPFYALVFFTFLVYITPHAYFAVLGPLHLARSCAIFAVATYILSVFWKKQPLLKLDTETFLLLVIVFLAIISIPFSIWPGGSFNVFQDIYVKAIIIFLLISNVVTSMKRLRVMLWSIVFFCTFFSIIAVRDFITGNFWQLDRIKGAGYTIAANPNDLALTLVLTIPFALSFFLIYKNKLIKLVCACYVLLSTIAIVCTFSRGGLITLVVVYGIFFLKMFRRNGAKILLPAVIMIIIFFSILPHGYTDRMSSIFDFNKDKTGSADARKESTVNALEAMLEHPILGVGLGMNNLALYEKGFGWEGVHNVYLQYGSELGIPAVLIFILLILKLRKNMVKIQQPFPNHQQNREMQLLAFGIEISLAGFAVAAFFHPVAYHFYFYYLAGFAVSLRRIASKELEAL